MLLSAINDNLEVIENLCAALKNPEPKVQRPAELGREKPVEDDGVVIAAAVVEEGEVLASAQPDQ